MTDSNKKPNIHPDIIWMLDVLQRDLEMDLGDPALIIDANRQVLTDVGAVFQFLGLARRDDQSILGWMPTQRLKQIAARDTSGQKFYPCDALLVVVVGGFAFDFSDGHDSGPAFNALEEIGVVTTDKSTFGSKCSEEFLELVDDSYYRWLLSRLKPKLRVS